MGLSKTIWASPRDYLRNHAPDDPVLFFSPAVLHATARRFTEGFPGLVTYAVKSNPDEIVLSNLSAAGIGGFDVASPFEMALVRRIAPGAAMHYNNPVRSVAEIDTAVSLGVQSYAVDSRSELEKLAGRVPSGAEISVRFKLGIGGAAYDFGAKFGADEDTASILMREAAALGFVPSLTFHPGTQCTDPMAWDAYIRAAARISRRAGIAPARLNVGGGFPAHRISTEAPRLETIFAAIGQAVEAAFGNAPPALVCEPGRAMVADAISLCTRIKAIRDGADVFLNDGVYGGLAELPLLGLTDRIEVRGPEGVSRSQPARPRTVFGPTCDSVDRLPGTMALPADAAEGDWVIFHGLGAYSTATVTRFNGYGALGIATVERLD